MRRMLILFILIVLAALLYPAQSQAVDIKPGFRVGGYFDAESAFVGGEVLVSLTHAWWFNPNVEYVFIDNGDLWTFNFDFHYDFLHSEPIYVWLGAGAAIIHLDREAPFRSDETDAGANIFGGVGFRVRGTRLVPYIQPKVILSDNSEFALAFGIRF